MSYFFPPNPQIKQKKTKKKYFTYKPKHDNFYYPTLRFNQ